MTEPPAAHPVTVQSFARGLAVIRAFDDEHPALTLSEVARLTGLTRAAARRFLHTLVAIGYMRNDGHSFSLRPRVLELGASYLSSSVLPAIAQPHLERLAAEVRESCSVSVLDDQDIVYVARMPADRITTLTIAVGTRVPAYPTSMGRVLLAGLAAGARAEVLARTELVRLTPRTITDAGRLAAELDAVHRRGYCIVDREFEEGLISVAAPVTGPDGTVLAALNLASHATPAGIARVRWLVPPLRRTATAIGADLARSRA